MSDLYPLYLCGPINGCTDTEANTWRDLVKGMWPYGTIDPMRRDYRGVESVRWKEIVELDKADIAFCSALIVNYLKPSVGSSMEIFFAHSIGKPIALVHAPGTALSPWLVYHTNETFNDFRAAIKWLNTLREGAVDV